MGKVHAVLLVPAEGDPLGLLREGARVAGLKGVPGQERWDLGWRVSDGQGGYIVAWDSGTFNNLHETLALVLAWDGEPVAAGCDHAQERVIHGGDPLNYLHGHRHWFRACVRSLLNPEPLLMEYAVQIRTEHRWTLIPLDADGREIGGGR